VRVIFTVNCAERRDKQLLVEQIDLLRRVFRKVKAEHPFHIDAIVVLPEHQHCIWTLPPGNADHKNRWVSRCLQLATGRMMASKSHNPSRPPLNLRGGARRGKVEIFTPS